MKTKPSSANTKKPLITNKPIFSNKPIVVKCFICNQMFYSQDQFDSHMDQHQKKMNKNLPQEIQRKTAESFGIKRKQSMSKKNTNLQAINQNDIKDKKIFNKTMKTPLTQVQSIQNPFVTKYGKNKPLMIKKSSTKIEQLILNHQPKGQISESPFKLNITADKQIAQIDEAIKQSNLLMSQMASLTQKYENQSQFFMTQETHSDHDQEDNDQVIQKILTEHEFISQIKNNNWSLSQIQKQILKVSFTTLKSLENYQIQIEYLRKVVKYSFDPKSLERMSKIKSKILAQVVSIIMSDNQNKSSVKNVLPSPQTIKVEQKQNSEARTCSECLDMIGFAETCLIQGNQSYHKECYIDQSKSFH